MRVSVCMCVCKCVRVCVCVCMNTAPAYTGVCVHVNIRSLSIYINTKIYVREYIHTHTCTFTHTYMYWRIHINIYIYTVGADTDFQTSNRVDWKSATLLVYMYPWMCVHLYTYAQHTYTIVADTGCQLKSRMRICQQCLYIYIQSQIQTARPRADWKSATIHVSICERVNIYIYTCIHTVYVYIHARSVKRG